MAVLCWVVLGLSVFLSPRSSLAAVDQSWLTNIVENIRNEYPLGDTYTVALNIPVNQDPESLTEVLNDDPEDKVKQTVSQGQVYQGTRVVAATQSDALARVLQKVEPLIKSSAGNALIVYSEGYLKANGIDSQISNIIQNWGSYAFVFSKVASDANNNVLNRDELFKRQAFSKFGLENIFRCYETGDSFQCTNCRNGNGVAPSCVQDEMQSNEEEKGVEIGSPDTGFLENIGEKLNEEGEQGELEQGREVEVGGEDVKGGRIRKGCKRGKGGSMREGRKNGKGGKMKKGCRHGKGGKIRKGRRGGKGGKIRKGRRGGKGGKIRKGRRGGKGGKIRKGRRGGKGSGMRKGRKRGKSGKMRKGCRGRKSGKMRKGCRGRKRGRKGKGRRRGKSGRKGKGRRRGKSGRKGKGRRRGKSGKMRKGRRGGKGSGMRKGRKRGKSGKMRKGCRGRKRGRKGKGRRGGKSGRKGKGRRRGKSGRKGKGRRRGKSGKRRGKRWG
ncbi:protein qua-1-like [Cyprinodon tularosa]|uniref:protein qua-1-like n=1 Tax=Cyprinodon tularosa TaxID=77115 RepID=UPI0018E21E81|nr:protein qua-1-like [Cyprinodon tularosa]